MCDGYCDIYQLVMTDTNKISHGMRLTPQPYELIASGQKTIEMRLNDSKRQKIKVGDIINFTCTDGREGQLSALVTALHPYESFKEMYASLPLDKCGYTPQNIKNASAFDMRAFYSKEAESFYGVLGIEIKLI